MFFNVDMIMSLQYMDNDGSLMYTYVLATKLPQFDLQTLSIEKHEMLALPPHYLRRVILNGGINSTCQATVVAHRHISAMLTPSSLSVNKATCGSQNEVSEVIGRYKRGLMLIFYTIQGRRGILQHSTFNVDVGQILQYIQQLEWVTYQILHFLQEHEQTK